MSSMSSMPTDRRMKRPETLSSQSATARCVIVAGWSMRDSTPPSDSARVMSSVLCTSSSARSSVSVEKETTPPNPLICFFAISWPGCEGSPG